MGKDVNTIRFNQGFCVSSMSAQASFLCDSAEVSLLGGSPKLFNTDKLVPLEVEDFTSFRDFSIQNGYFTSKTDGKVFQILQDGNNKDSNPIKRLENQAGTGANVAESSSTLAKEVASENKSTTNLKQDNQDASSREENQSLSNTSDFAVGSMTPSSSTETKDGILPYVTIRESRTGTASYTEMNADSYFNGKTGSEANESLVEIQVLQNVTSFDFTTEQSIQDVDSRGSQTPLRFYNNNPGRQLSFTANFHQQEYPYEPLLSIAEKAQYLARPYKHTDYSLIPKLVEIVIPGRVFRGYVTSVGVGYMNNGDGDYTSWNRVSIEAGRLGEQSGFYGGYKSRMITQRDRDNRWKFSKNNEGEYSVPLYYGYGAMTLSFRLAIVEEIKLTTFETSAEYNNRIQEEKRQSEIEENQLKIEQARRQLEVNFGSGDPTQRSQNWDQYIYVDQNGNFVGIKYTDADGNVLLLDPPTGLPEGAQSLDQYNLAQEMKKGDPNKKEVVTTLITQADESFAILEAANNPGEQIAILLEQWKKANPTGDATAEENRLRGLSDQQLYEEYSEKVINQDMIEKDYYIANLISVSEYRIKVGNTYKSEFGPDITNKNLKAFLTTPITDINDAIQVLKFIKTGKSLEIDFNLMMTGLDPTPDESILGDICYWNGLGYKGENYFFPYHLTCWNAPSQLQMKDDEFGVYFKFNDPNDDKYVNFIRGTSLYPDVFKEIINKYIAISFEDIAKLTKDQINELIIKESQVKTDDTIIRTITHAVAQVRGAFYKGFYNIVESYRTKYNKDKITIFPTEAARDWYYNSIGEKLTDKEILGYWEFDED